MPPCSGILSSILRFAFYSLPLPLPGGGRGDRDGRSLALTAPVSLPTKTKVNAPPPPPPAWCFGDSSGHVGGSYLRALASDNGKPSPAGAEPVTEPGKNRLTKTGIGPASGRRAQLGLRNGRYANQSVS